MARQTIPETSIALKPVFIYGLIDPRTSELRYVGKTERTLAIRLQKHLDAARYARRLVYSMAWCKSLMNAGVAPEIVELEVVPVGACWVEAEQFWVAYMRALGCRLVNQTKGGEGLVGFKMPDEAVAKLSTRMKRLWQDPDYRRRTSEAHIGYKPSPESIAKRAAKMRGRKVPESELPARSARMKAFWADPDNHARTVARMRESLKDRDFSYLQTEERRALVSKALKGRPKTEEHNAKVSSALKAFYATHRHHVSIAVEIDGVVYPTKRAATDTLKISFKTLQKMLADGRARLVTNENAE